MTNDAHSRRLLLRVGLIAPLALLALALLLQALALPHLPDPVAVHWGLSGAPDGFGRAWSILLITAIIGLLLPALLVGAAMLQSRADPRWPSRGGSYRMLGAMSLGTTTLVLAMFTGGLLIQVGLARAADGPTLWGTIIVSVALGVLSGFIAWNLLPAAAAFVPAPAMEPLSLADHERAAWIGTATMSRGGAIGLLITVLLVIGGGFGLVLAGTGAAGWVTAGIGTLVGLFAASNLVFRVSVDASGLGVRSVLGVPRFRVPAAEVVSASVVSVSPLAEFGGWGLRWAPAGQFGVILRAGEAIEVTRTVGRTFVVTVDDAATAAALLMAVAGRESGSARAA